MAFWSSLNIRGVYAKFGFLNACISSSLSKNVAASILFSLEIHRPESIIHTSYANSKIMTYHVEAGLNVSDINNWWLTSFLLKDVLPILN